MSKNISNSQFHKQKSFEFCVLTDDSASVFSLDPLTEKCSELDKIQFKGLIGGVCDGEFYYLINSHMLVKLNSMFEVVEEMPLGDIGSVAYGNNTLCISAQGCFLTLNGSLEVLHRIELDCDGMKKNAHDIMIHCETAYLLDNLVSPIFVFKVNLTDPGKLVIKERFHIEGLNSHLQNQWLNSGKWYILENYFSRGVNGQELHIISERTCSGYHEKRTICENVIQPQESRKGIMISDVTDDGEWAAGVNERNRVELFQIRVGSETVRSNCFTLPAINGSGGGENNGIINQLLYRAGKYLLLATCGTDTEIRLFEVTDPPQIMATAKLKQVKGVKEIIEVPSK